MSMVYNHGRTRTRAIQRKIMKILKEYYSSITREHENM